MVIPEAVEWVNQTGIVWPQRGPCQRNINAPNKAPVHVVSRSAAWWLNTRLCESTRQRHVVDDLVNGYTDLKFCHLLYLLSDLDFIFTTMADLVGIPSLSSCDDFKSD